MVAGASDLLASVAFLVYGVRLFTLDKDQSDDLSPQTRRQRIATLAATLLFCSCFVLVGNEIAKLYFLIVLYAFYRDS